ncbi:hypothetical protein BX667DRAFT_518757 [Coemansia mojavensis]|nr:hypothetical protein BX667DRAFT_518757 [Coemansia mojavensis]
MYDIHVLVKYDIDTSELPSDGYILTSPNAYNNSIYKYKSQDTIDIRLEELELLDSEAQVLFISMSDTEKPDFGKVKHWYNSIVQDYLKVDEIHNVEVTYLEYAFDPVHAVLIEGEELELQSLINKILPNDKLKDYFLYHLASCLSYGNLDKVFVIWSGIGSNGKLMKQLGLESE